MRRSLFATMTIAFGVMLVVFAASASMALAMTAEEMMGNINCKDKDDDCFKRKSGTPGVAATCVVSTGTQPCEKKETAQPGTSCSCQQNPLDSSKCYCKATST